MQDTVPSAPGCHAPRGEPLPLVVWLVAPAAGLVSRLRDLGAYVVVSAAGETVPWPRELSLATEECRHRFARAYVIRRRGSAAARVSAGIPGTPAHDADPWTVALLAGAVRDAGLAAGIDPARPGGGTSDGFHGFELALPDDADPVLAAAVDALADGLRIAQLKC